MMTSRRSLLVAVIALLVLGCGTSLTDGEWVWCGGNSNRVASAARDLGIAEDPGWWSRCRAAGQIGQGTGDVYTDLLTGAQDYYDCVGSDPEYIAACRAVTRANGGPTVSGSVLSGTEIAFCEKYPYWSATRTQSLSMGQHWYPSRTGTPSWVMRNVAVNALRGDGDYVRSCEAAFKARSG